MKKLVTSYTFSASAKTVDSADFTSLEKILLITNVTDQIIIYNFADTSKGGTLAGTTLTLEYDTSSMDDTDKLQIFVEDAAAVQPVSGAFYQTTQPVSLATVPSHEVTNAGTFAVQASGTVTANAGTNLNTSALALESGGNLAAIKAKTDNIPALGQALGSASVPVVLPAAQITTLTPPAAITGFATEAKQLPDNHQVTVSNIASTPLITGFATSTKQSDGSQKTQIVDAGGEAVTVTGGKLDVNASIDTTGLALDATLTGGSQKSQIVDAGGEAVTVTGGKLDVNASIDTTGLALAANQLPDGHNVTIANASIPVTGTFWQATQPISGTVTANTGLTQPLTDTQLRATAVPVSGTVAVTNAGITTIAGAVAGTEMQVDVLTMPTTTVTATDLDIRNLTNTDVVTAELSAVDNAVLDTIAAKDFATQTTLAAMNAKLVSGTDIGDVTINNAGGAAAVNIQDGGNAITVDGAVTVTNGTAANLNMTEASAAAIKTAVEALDNSVDGNYLNVNVNLAGTDVTHAVAALNSTGGGIPTAAMVAQFDDTSTSSVTENQFAHPRISSRRALLVEGVASGTAMGVSVASGGIASGAIASGAVASGAVASGAVASGAVVDGAIVTLGAKTDAKSTATDGTSVSAMQVLKQISASVQSPPSQAVTNAGTFAVQATLAAETTKVIGTVNIAASQTVGLATGSNAIGKLAANSGVDIGDVDVASIATGTNAIGRVGHDITGIGHGVKTVTTAGTDVALAASTTCKKVDIQAQTDNTNIIAVGGSGVDATIATGTGIVLYPGETYSLEIDNLADVYIDSLVNGEGARFTYYT